MKNEKKQTTVRLPADKKNRTQRTIRLPETLLEFAKTYAQRFGISFNDFALTILNQMVLNH